MENKIVRHVLIGRFSPEMTAGQFDELIRAFSELAKKIEGILSFEYGENNSPEGLNEALMVVDYTPQS